MVGVEEREDEIERLRHDGRVHFWSKRGSTSGASASTPWPGHTTFVALRGGQVVLGDRYAGEGIERTYACDLHALLEGCFQELVEQQLGSQVLAELLAEVRRELGVPESTGASPKQAGSPTKNAQAPAPAAESPAARTTSPSSKTEAGKTEAGKTDAGKTEAGKAGASAPAAPAPTPSASKAVSAPSKPRPAAAASERPSSPASAPAAATAVGSTSAAHVDVTLVACSSVGLPLAVALRGITRAPVHELLGRLRSLPCRVAGGVPREQAEGLAARLLELGAEVRLVPAGGS